MKKESILKTIAELREKSKKRNFSQTLDLTINFRKLDLKKPEHKVDVFIVLPNGLGKKLKICGLIDKELVLQAKEVFDRVITKEQFPVMKKQEVKKIAHENDFFVAQSTLMVETAKYFGKILGPMGKMPNPKSGCVVPPNANLKMLYERLQKTIRANTKNEIAIKCKVGKDILSNEELAGNALYVYETVVKLLPNEKENVSKVFLKFTMSDAVEVKDE